ncbi:hypothetical protein [Streptomyces sp. 6N223]|uniref:hypothetical protein n=1 Tax=Streptomyces sp. 6N223 TaxID=3457412 RepID=UPI003FD559F4
MTTALDRVLRQAGVPGLLETLAEHLPPTDLQTLLLEVYRRRAAAVSPGRLLDAYARNRFTAPSALAAPGELARLEALIHERLAAHGVTGVALSPLSPLGTNAAVATVDQNKVVSTARNTEVVADATNVLALECAVRRRAAPRGEVVRLGATHRVVRAQAFDGPAMAAHFALFGLCTAGRDAGSFRFETRALTEQLALHLDLLGRAADLGHRATAVRVSLTDLTTEGRHRAALRERVLDPLAAAHPGVAFGFDDERPHGRGYYAGVCFEIHAATPAGDEITLIDGGFTTWTASLLSNAKERLLISGLGTERLIAAFRATPAGG